MRFRRFSAALVILCFASSASAPLRAAEEPAAPAQETDSGNDGETITMSFDGASLKDVLLLFSQKTGMNFVASQEVEQKKITVYFENVSPKEAIDAIMTTNNLTYTRNPGSSIYMVYPKRAETPELVTKVFRLKYARLSLSPLDVGGQETVKDLKTIASAGSSSSSSSSSSEESSSGSSSSSSANATQGSPRGIDSVVSAFLSKQGKMAVDVNTNSLIVTDTAEVVAQIQKMLVDLDVPQTQVILEVHVMEIQKGLVSDQGIEWGGDDGEFLSLSGGQMTTGFPLKESIFQNEFPAPPQVVTPDDFNDTGVGDNLPHQMTFGTISASSFSAVLHFIVSDSKTKILARPRVLTQNNEAAIIRLVANTAIANQTETTTSQGTTTSSTNEAERSETGVTLRMTPQINPDDSVTLFLEPSVTTVGASVFFPGVFLDPTTRFVRTMARVQNDQTLVIGGLIDSNQTTSKRKIPYLGDIPGLGRLFSYDAGDDQDRELIVFITPHIVRGQNSLLQNNVTAKGRDVLAKKMLDEFVPDEADIHLSAFESRQKNTDTVYQDRIRRELESAAKAGSKASDPAVEKQMSMALDAFSPQLLDDEITKALSFQSSSGRSANG